MAVHHLIRIVQSVVFGAAFALLNVAPTASASLDLPTVGIRSASAGLFESTKKKEKAREKACKEWCQKNSRCKKCGKRVCGLGYRRIKSWTGRGANWHACELSKRRQASAKHEKDCKAWCKKTPQCAKCSKLPCPTAIGYRLLKTWSGFGKNWYACKPLPNEKDLCCNGKDVLGCSAPNLVRKWKKVFHDACARHDYCYIYGKHTYAKGKDQCDKDFLSDMRAICEKGKRGAVCRAMARTFQIAVAEFAGPEYDPTTEKRCWYPDRLTTKAERKEIGQCRQEAMGD